MSEPLTPEEEAAIRDSMRVKWGLPLSPQSFQDLAARLLATLDAEREVARANAELADHWKTLLDASQADSRRKGDRRRVSQADSLREALLDIGADHEDCVLSVDRIEDDPELGPGHWLLVCETHEGLGPLLDFAALAKEPTDE